MKFDAEINTVFKEGDEHKRAVMNIIYTSNFLDSRLMEAIKPYGINDQHFNILRILRGKKHGKACPGEVKENLLNKRGDLTRLLDKLVTMDLVIREQNAENRRMVDLSISQQGLDLLKLLDAKFNESKEFETRLTPEEANQLSDLLDKVRG